MKTFAPFVAHNEKCRRGNLRCATQIRSLPDWAPRIIRDAPTVMKNIVLKLEETYEVCNRNPPSVTCLFTKRVFMALPVLLKAFRYPRR